MRRREFILALGGAATWPLTARAEQEAPLIGFLWFSSPAAFSRELAAFRRGFRWLRFGINWSRVPSALNKRSRFGSRRPPARAFYYGVNGMAP
jgi:hypothetical protein